MSSKPIPPKDRLGKAIFDDIKSYTSKGQAIPSEEKEYNVLTRKANSVSPAEYRIGRPKQIGSRNKKSYKA